MHGEQHGMPFQVSHSTSADVLHMLVPLTFAKLHAVGDEGEVLWA